MPDADASESTRERQGRANGSNAEPAQRRQLTAGALARRRLLKA